MSGPLEKIRRGDIWVIEPAGFPKPRPALVVSINPVNDFCPDVLLVPLTTKPGPLRVPLAQSPDMTGLEASSFAKCESVGPVHKQQLKRRIGHIPRGELCEIEAGIKKVLGL
jgi:mRNA-degrading endonuclease toxin of MazEF toxin-antitoxin module